MFLSIDVELYEGVSEFIDCDINIELIHYIHDNSKYNYCVKARHQFKEKHTLTFYKYKKFYFTF